ncbi:Variant surface glycoprotein [Trypanosoma congolense IL3000]|uniref:Variant surface glycoprotein n=1 Tax=Trypanosoma congolense (strain IL3000) TaxID=1068625 RepID=F9WJ15_TRYCI|nr:Variant surface glycoprotein [Trypanosoma congolense IL3000]
MMKFWIVVMVFVELVSAESGDTDHNRAQHDAICTLLQIAVDKWVSGGASLTEPLRTALEKTIFGEGVEPKIETLKSGLPAGYATVVDQFDSRSVACGQPHYDIGDGQILHQVRWSGHSATHDLVCLCTVGDGGWPLNETSINNLCGKTLSDLGGEEKKGWHGEGSGKPQIEATWKNVTVPCLKEEKGKDLKQTLSDFLRKLENKSIHAYPNRYQLGKGEPGEIYACTGSPLRGVCVEYYNSTTTLYPLPWWSELEKAIQKDEEIQEQKKRDEEKKRKQQDEAEQQNSQKPETLKSGHPTTNQTEGSHKDNPTDTIRRYNLTSGTPISMPSTWLLSVAILI